MKRCFAILTLVSLVVLAPSASAQAPDLDSGWVSEILAWLVERTDFVRGMSDASETLDPDTGFGPGNDPNGVEAEEADPPSTELGPVIDPDG